MIRVPFGPCDAKVSRKGSKPCWSGDLVVYYMLGPRESRWVRNCCVYSALWISNVSSPNLSQTLGGLGKELKALVLKSSMKRFANTGIEGIP